MRWVRLLQQASRAWLPDLKQCLYGFTPFVCENREDTKARILVSKANVPVDTWD